MKDSATVVATTTLEAVAILEFVAMLRESGSAVVRQWVRSSLS
jgi:hypothetical protein